MQNKVQDKKVIVLIILGIVAIASLIYGVVTPPRKTGRVEQKTEDVSHDKMEKKLLVPRAQAKGHAVKSKFKSWKRRPFVPANVPGSSFNLVLNGILGSGANLKAMIGAAIVSKGDKVGNNTVVDIKKNSVILNDGTKDFELKLKK